MNQNDQLPTELVEIEALLAGRRREKTPDYLRREVLSDVRTELHFPLKSNNWRSFAASVAACLMLAMNLAIASVNVSDYSPSASTRKANVDETTRLVQDLLPELTDKQARRHSMVLGGARPSPLP